MPSSLIEHVRRNYILIVASWTLIILVSLWANRNAEKKHTRQITTAIARSNFNKDMAYRLWAASHGGVYVPPNEKTPPNPYLDFLPERDVMTTTGKKLTLMNPAYMLRQMMNDYSDLYGIKGRIVGLVYVNPDNKADAWEEDAIRSFQKGAKEKLEISEIDGAPYLRLMRPFYMQKTCMKCHRQLGFQPGDVRGAVGVSVPLKSFYEYESRQNETTALTHLLIWVLGLGFITLVSRFNYHSLKEKQKRIDQLHLAYHVFENSLDAIFITNPHRKIIQPNHSFTKITGYSGEEIAGKTPLFLRSDLHNRDFYKKIWSTLRETGQWQGTIWERKHDGSTFAALTKLVVVKDSSGDVLNYIGSFNDTTEKLKYEERVYNLAHYDTLTGFPNRVMLRKYLEQRLEEAGKTKEKIYLIYLDLDGFKKINDTMGHEKGDQLLRIIASRISKYAGKDDFISRTGGDEFTVILAPKSQEKDVLETSGSILKEISLPIDLSGGVFFISGSIGISVFPDDAHTMIEMIQHADTALYHSKGAGKNRYSFYNREMTEQEMRRISLENSLHIAIEDKKLRVFYQPKIDIARNRITGMEALVRWKHPTKGMISPLEFIPLAEESGMIIDIDHMILEAACRDTKQWLDEGYDLQVAVNISGHTVLHEGLPEALQEILDATGLPPRNLELEITEGVFMGFEAEQVDTLRRLHQMGVALAIDDFGTGYSSLAYLKYLPVNTLKIDATFIREVHKSDRDKALISYIINMAHSLNLRTIAEGVETKEHCSIVRAKGCDDIQGYLFSRPLNDKDFFIYLKNNYGKEIGTDI